MPHLALFLLFVLSLCASSAVHAKVQLAKVFTDQMVIQQEMPIRVWGRADPGEGVAVSFAGQTGKARAGDDGTWRVDLPALKADGKTHTLKVVGSNTIEFNEVVLGEVWIAAGQSNMNREVAVEGDRPGIRLLWIEASVTPVEQGFGDNLVGWTPATKEKIDSVMPARKAINQRASAGTAEVGWVFGQRVHEAKEVPVGIIKTAFGGSQALAWTPIDKFTEKYTYGKVEEGGYLGHRAGLLYNTMLQWLGPMSVRGVVWYQGENDGRNWGYDQDLSKMIAAWRDLFEQPELPFYLAQISQTSYASNMLRVWECQAKVSADDPHVYLGMSVNLYDAVDGKGAPRLHEDTDREKGTGWPLAGSSNPHPPNKHIVANRLADLALVNTYGKDLDKEVHAPRYHSHTAEGNKLIVKFTNVGDGLKTDDGKAPDWFEISDGLQGERKGERFPLIYHQANAKIVGKDTIELTAEGVGQPIHVRLGWHTYARHNTVGSSGLPVVNFRTDTQQTKAR